MTPLQSPAVLAGGQVVVGPVVGSAVVLSDDEIVSVSVPVSVNLVVGGPVVDTLVVSVPVSVSVNLVVVAVVLTVSVPYVPVRVGLVVGGGVVESLLLMVSEPVPVSVTVIGYRALRPHEYVASPPTPLGRNDVMPLEPVTA